MKIINSSIGSVSCFKKPEYIGKVINEKNASIIFAFGTSPEIKEDSTQVVTSIEVSFRDPKNGKEKMGEFRTFVVVNLELEEQDKKSAEEDILEIKYYALAESWPHFESQAKLLREFKLEIDKFPELPPRAEILSLLSEEPNKR